MSAPVATAWFLWLIASIFYAYQYILRVMPAIMLEDIIARFQINPIIFGQFAGIYYLSYSLVHLPIGILIDRYGPGKIMSACIGLTVLGQLPLLFADHWLYAVAGRALIGIGSSAAILGTFKIIRLTFREQRFTRMLSISVAIGLLGAIYGGGPVRYLCENVDYQFVMKISMLIGIIIASITYALMPNIKNKHQIKVLADFKGILSHKKVIWACILAGLMIGPLEGFADVWGKVFLKQVYGFDDMVAAGLPSLIFIGMGMGAPMLSLISERTGHYLRVVAIAGLIMAASFFGLTFEKLTRDTIAFSFIIVGICCAYQILAIYKISTYVPARSIGITTALANMIIMSFGYVFHTIIGIVIHLAGGFSSKGAFIAGMVIIPITLSLGVIGFTLLMWEERKR